MIIAKTDLYKKGWVDLVFAGRNKNYGAYDLRKHSANTTNKAMLITFTTVTALLFGLGYAVRAKNTDVFKVTHVELHRYVPVPPKDEKVHEIKHTTVAKKAMVSTTQVLVPKVTTDPVTVEPPKLDQIKGEVGPENIDVDPGQIGIVEVGATKEGKPDAAPVIDNTTHDIASVDIEPEPYGGMAAWNKFLQKNMRYPTMAIDAGKSGKVYLSFIVEKDGSITDITVLRGPGYGMDEEAKRVLKLAPLWRPGMQHSQKVRVKYTLPFNFQLDQ